jgi:hypothetical protein
MLVPGAMCSASSPLIVIFQTPRDGSGKEPRLCGSVTSF